MGMTIRSVRRIAGPAAILFILLVLAACATVEQTDLGEPAPAQTVDADEPATVEPTPDSALIQVPESTPEPTAAATRTPEPEFDEPLFPVRVGWEWGYIDQEGEIAIEPQFDHAEHFSGGLGAVKIDRQWGFIDHSGSFAIEPELMWKSHFSEGLAAVGIGGEIVGPLGIHVAESWGFIDRSGEFAIEPRFDGVGSFRNGLAPVLIDGQFGYIDPIGSFVFAPQFDLAGPFEGGQAIVQVDGERRFIDRDGNVIDELDVPEDYPVERAWYAYGLMQEYLDAGWATMDFGGNTMIVPNAPPAESLTTDVEIRLSEPFINGLARVWVEPASIMHLPLREAEWGYIDSGGQFVWFESGLPPQTMIGRFMDEFADGIEGDGYSIRVDEQRGSPIVIAIEAASAEEFARGLERSYEDLRALEFFDPCHPAAGVEVDPSPFPFGVDYVALMERICGPEQFRQ